VDNARIVDGSSIKVGDILIGLASSGLHANGYSLARKVLEKSGLSGNDILPGTDRAVRDVFLEPTIIYADCVRSLLRDLSIKGMSHITGGGFYDNIPRVLPAQVGAKVAFGSWPVPPVFTWLASAGNLSWPEMLQIFNCGIGYVLVVDKRGVDEIMDRLKAMEQPAWQIGAVERLKSGQEDRVSVVF
jgi:phosphoribosylformylglycinamidine cyclo-ligase